MQHLYTFTLPGDPCVNSRLVTEISKDDAKAAVLKRLDSPLHMSSPRVALQEVTLQTKVHWVKQG